MIKTYLKRAFQLSDSGVKGLAKSIWSFFLYYVSFVPPMICVFLFADRLLNGNAGKPVVYLLFMLGPTNAVTCPCSAVKDAWRIT
jgi:ATP-binding cassette, subfamily B, bacterial IrtB/YbtQ